MSEITKFEARDKAHENAMSLNELIDPSDVDPNAEKWEDIDPDKLDMEIHESISVIRSENQSPYDRLAYDLAIGLWRDSMPRVPMGDMAFETEEKAVRKGYWPNKMDKWTCREILEDYSNEYEYFYEFLDEAWEYVSEGIYQGMHPLKE